MNTISSGINSKVATIAGILAIIAWSSKIAVSKTVMNEMGVAHAAFLIYIFAGQNHVPGFSITADSRRRTWRESFGRKPNNLTRILFKDFFYFYSTVQTGKLPGIINTRIVNLKDFISCRDLIVLISR